MRKKMVLAVSVIMAMSLMTGCGAKETAEATTEATEAVTIEETETETETEEVTEAEAEDASATDSEWTYGEYTYTGDDNVMYAITNYICDELAKGYEASDVGIPYIIEVSRDDSDANDIKVWGCFYYYTYNLVGDTLECQAGGSYPGLMHVQETDAGCGYEVTEYEPVLDGSDFDSSAKEIFDDKYDAFMDIYSNDGLNEEKRNEYISDFVLAHGVPATKYQDYGWDPVDLSLNVISGDGIEYIGGLYANDGKSDINIAFFLSDGEQIVIIQEGEHYYYGSYELEDVFLEDGTMYSEITVEGKTYGYMFEDEEQSIGFIIDQDGNKHSALGLDESVANDMKNETM
ncbi:hypothetical protein SAMN02910369_00705 [Lachnospiraceae bacterium NE2001]|nr:hypothetical protein SAMN02910369_00705 [Lachnospiraceae bacterium NE2001]